MKELLQNAGQALGSVKGWYYSLEQALNGWPDYLLSLAMIISGIVVILTGLFAPRWLKLVMLAWIIFP